MPRVSKTASLIAIGLCAVFALAAPDAAARDCKHANRDYRPGEKLKLYGFEHVCGANGIWKIIERDDYDTSRQCRVGDKRLNFGDTTCRNGTLVLCGANGQAGPVFGSKCLSFW